MQIRNLAVAGLGVLVFSLAGFAQTTSLEGDVKGADGAPYKDAKIKIDREDIKGHYEVKTNKKGHYFYGGLPLGTYKVTLEIEGKDVDFVDHVRTRLGDPMVNNFDMQAQAKRQHDLNEAAQNGTLSKDQARGMSAEEKAAFEKANKERADLKAKNKALNDAYNAGREAMNAKQYDVAIAQLTKASEMAPDQVVIWANLGDADVAMAKTKTGPERDEALNHGLDAYKKAMEIKPDDASVHNNYALALVEAKKFDEAKAELAKAAQLDPQAAGKYYFNLGAVLVNNGHSEEAGEVFKKAIEVDPNYADAHYQYGIFLMGKAKVGADGKYDAPPGTREAFEKYLQLKPDGSNAETAKAMLASLTGAVDTSYQNPSAKKKPATKKN